MDRVLIEKYTEENNGALYDVSIYKKTIKKKWYQIFKKDSYQFVSEMKFIKAIRPSLKILLES